MIYRIRELIQEGKTESKRKIKDRNEFREAIRLVEKSITDCKISMIQGPPGTGKTTVFEGVLKKIFDRVPGYGCLYLYVAPTNELVAQMLIRMCGILFSLGYDEQYIKETVRVYGSKFDYTDFKNLRMPINEDVRLVITTEYQRVRGDFEEIHFMIDEASRSVVHRPFVTSSEELIRRIERGEVLYGSINVIGDPLQAIVLEDRYRQKRNIRLIMEVFTTSLLKQMGITCTSDNPIELMNLAYDNLKGEYFEILERTFRLPSPTEIPVSKGYYDNKLKALFKAEERLKDYWTEKLSSNQCDNRYLRWAIKVVEEALTTELIPVILVEPKDQEDYRTFEERTGIIFSRERAKLASAFALALCINTKGSTCITAPYKDQILYTKMYLQREYGDLLKKYKCKIKFETAQSMLGSEADNVVTILGKEYSGSSEYKTIYFQEPELLNVQLTRHKRVLVVIGNLRRLCKKAREENQKERTRRYKPISVTSEYFLRLADVNVDIVSRVRSGERSEGYGAIYYKTPF